MKSWPRSPGARYLGSMSNAQLEAAVLSLAEGERADLALKLIDSLSVPGTPVLDDAAWQAAWFPEIQRRMKAVRDGSEETFDADDVLDELRRELRSR